MYARFNEETASCLERCTLYYHQSLIYWVQNYYEVKKAYLTYSDVNADENLKHLTDREWTEEVNYIRRRTPH